MGLRPMGVVSLSVLWIPLLSGCLGKIVGGTLPPLTNDWLLPTMLASPDVDAGCASGEALGSLVAAFRSTGHRAARAGVIPQMAAGMCVEEDVQEAQLAHARAMFDGDGPAAQDSLMREERAHMLAAIRYSGAFEVLSAEYGVPGTGEECPRLKTDSDELSYLLGLSSGLLAVLHDTGAGGRIGVSLGVAGDVVRGTSCLDNAKWWGVPEALKASVWAVLPGAPQDRDPWEMFEASIALGDQAGVRLASALAVQMAGVLGDDARLREEIRRHAEAMTREAAPEWRMLDTYGSGLVLHESDLIWTHANGYRTPLGDLGTFPDDPEEVEEDLGDLEDFFDEPVEGAAATEPESSEE